MEGTQTRSKTFQVGHINFRKLTLVCSTKQLLVNLESFSLSRLKIKSLYAIRVWNLTSLAQGKGSLSS